MLHIFATLTQLFWQLVMPKLHVVHTVESVLITKYKLSMLLTIMSLCVIILA